MADSTSNIDPIVQSQAQKEVTANAFFDAASPATMFGRRASACGGLTWGYYGAKLLISGTPTNISNGTIALTASATNYIEVNRSGTVSKNTTGFTPGSLPLYTAVTNATSVTSWTDLRVTAITLDRYTQNNFAVTTADVTLTADQARCEYLYVTGALTGNRSIIVPLSWSGIIHNATTGAFTLTVKAASGLGVVVTQGTAALLYANGTDVVRQNSDARPGRLVKAMADANQTLSQLEAQNEIIECTGSNTAQRDLIVPIIDARQWTIFCNTTTNGIRVIGATGTGIAIAVGKRAIVYADGTNVVRVTADT